MVMGQDSCLKGCGFESRHCILDGHFFTLICCKNCSDCLIRPKINEKEARVGPFLKKEKRKLGAKYQTPIKTQIQRKYKLSLNTFYSIDSRHGSLFFSFSLF